MKHLKTIPVLLACLGLSLTLQAAEPTLDGNVVSTLRQRIELAPTGLPAGIVIAPAPGELLIASAAAEGPTESDLQAVGRGQQLRAPMRLEALSEGNTLVFEATKAAVPTVVDGVVKASSELKGGNLTAAIDSTYDGTGGITLAITFGGQVESMALVLDLAGPIDMAFAGDIEAAGDTRLSMLDGVIWTNAKPAEGDAQAGRQPGIIRHFHVGSGDRGFTLSTDGQGWQLDPAAGTMVLERDKAGQVTWRINLVNRASTLNRDTYHLQLQVHPATLPQPPDRLRVWNPQAQEAFRPASDVARQEADGTPVLLQAPGGATPLSDVLPIDHFRYLAGTHTGQTPQLLVSHPEHLAAGRLPDLDRMALGRALLHDIGLDARGLTHRVEGLKVIKALHRLGYFEGDGQTQFLPYWRNRAILRYGEDFAAADAFATTEVDPLARVYTSAYIRPAGNGTYKALIIVVNESEHPVREQFYVLQPALLFGAANQVMARTIVGNYDYTHIPAESDWNKARLVGSAVRQKHGSKPLSGRGLHDLEDDGFVLQTAAEGGIEVYGPLYIPARSYRIIYGTGGR